MKSPHIEDEDEPGFFKRNLVMIIIGGIALAGGGYFAATYTPSKPTAKKMEVDVFVPKPTPVIIKPEVKKDDLPPEVKKDEKAFIEQPEVKTVQTKPVEKPVDKPSNEPLGTAIAGGDGSGLGLGGGSSGGGGLVIGGSGGEGGGKWGWYAGQVQNRLADALRSNPVTRRAGFINTVKVWADNTGRITRVKLAGSTGDSRVDAVIENEVFNGLVLNEPPPDDMPMPINLRLTAR